MPANATSFGPYDAGSGANITEDFWRKFMSRLAPSAVQAGVNNELNPFGDSTGLQAKVDTGAAWVRGQYGEWTASVSVLGLAAVGLAQRPDLLRATTHRLARREPGQPVGRPGPFAAVWAATARQASDSPCSSATAPSIT